MQSIVGTLVLGRPDLGEPISRLSPWLDMLIVTDAEVFGRLERQAHRRFIKTHTPLDGIPRLPTVTYLCVIRHPLDVALSDRDHGDNMRVEQAIDLRVAASGAPDPDIVSPEEGPAATSDYLRWFIDNDNQPTGSGPYGLADYCQQVLTYWEARGAPNVHLFHYDDMWRDLDGEMRRVADVLDVRIDEGAWPGFVEAATIGSMRSRAAITAPIARHRDVALGRGVLQGGRHPGVGVAPRAIRPGPLPRSAPRDRRRRRGMGAARSCCAGVISGARCGSRSVPMPSAASSTSAPGHSRLDGSASSSTGGKGPSANASPRSSTASCDTDATSRNRRRRGAVQVPLEHVALVDLHLHEHRLRIHLVGGDHARPDRDRHAVGRRDRRAAPPTAPASRSRACSRRRGAHASGSTLGPRADHGRDLRLVLEPRGVERPRHVLLRSDDASIDLDRAGRQQGTREQRRSGCAALHAPLPHVVA